MSTDKVFFLWDLQVLLNEVQMTRSQISGWMGEALSLACAYPSLSYPNLENTNIRVYSKKASEKLLWGTTQLILHLEWPISFLFPFLQMGWYWEWSAAPISKIDSDAPSPSFFLLPPLYSISLLPPIHLIIINITILYEAFYVPKLS